MVQQEFDVSESFRCVLRAKAKLYKLKSLCLRNVTENITEIALREQQKDCETSANSP